MDFFHMENTDIAPARLATSLTIKKSDHFFMPPPFVEKGGKGIMIVLSLSVRPSIWLPPHPIWHLQFAFKFS